MNYEIVVINMKIKLQGIGIIKNSEIELNGLTVITGDNNSGKTTIGKVVYSLFDAVSDLNKNAEIDKNTYAVKTLQNIARDLEFLSVCFDDNSPNNKELSFLFSKHFIRQTYAISTAKELYNWLINFSETGFDLLDDEKKEYISKSISTKYIVSANNDITFNDIMGILTNMALESLTKLFNDLESDPHLIDYTREKISQTLLVEFSGQIQPVIFDVKKSSIVVKEKNKICFRFNIVDNKIVNNNEPVYYDSSVNKAFFVDNPFVLDSDDFIGSIVSNYNNDYDSDENFINKRRICCHDVNLRRFLKRPTNNIFELNILEKQNSKITAKINEVISGDFEFSNDGDYYISKGRKLRFANLATGSKLFSILKLLIEKGALNDSTVLILDEPEAHLHPAWQNKFAEVIVMLVKELDVKVLLTSHSPNFVLAIDAYMRKYEINKKTNFYQTRFTDDGFAEYVNVDNDMGLIYSDFVQYLTEVKLLRNKYAHGLGEDND